MSNITTYPGITNVSGEDLLIISDMSIVGHPTRSVNVDALVGGSSAVLSLTVNGTSGAATLIDNVLNVPQYSGGGTVTNVSYSTNINAFAAGVTNSSSSPDVTLTLNGGSVGQFLRQDGEWATVPSGGGTMSQWYVDDGGAGGFQVANNNTVTVNGSNKILVATNTAAKSIAWTHTDTVRTDTTSTVSPAAGATFTVVDSITQDATGHPTAVNVKTVTMPAGGGGAGTTYDLASAQDGSNVDITLTPSTGAVDTVQLTAGSGITLTDNGSNNITIDAAAGGSGLWTATGNDIYNNNSNAVVIGKTTAATDTTAALEISGRVSQVGLGDSTFFGYLAGNSTSTSNKRCAAFGNLALYLNVSSLDNTAIGERALFRTTGSGNTGVGSTALGNNTSGTNNVAIGDDALRSSVTASTNTAVGAQSLYSVTSSANVGVGYRALEGGTTGVSNTGLGAYSLRSADTSSFNTAVGNSAMEFIASGNGRNVAVGVSSGSNYGTGAGIALTVCNDSIFIGDSTRALGTGGSNEIVIGQGALGNGSNTITLGNADNEETHLTGVLVLEGYAFAALPASPVVGMRTYITDGGTPTYGGTASGGGSNVLPVFYNGSNWIYA